VVKEVAHVVQSHEDHDGAANRVDRSKAPGPFFVFYPDHGVESWKRSRGRSIKRKAEFSDLEEDALHGLRRSARVSFTEPRGRNDCRQELTELGKQPLNKTRSPENGILSCAPRYRG
jgi:hypothetical protein